MRLDWKKGDKFIPLPEDEWGSTRYQTTGWSETMRGYIGKELVVEDLYRDYGLVAKGWNWGISQVKPAQRVLSLTIKSTPL